MLAHHAGEQLLLTAAAGLGAGSIGLAIVRVRVRALLQRFRRR
jgi:hypothetical protein